MVTKDEKLSNGGNTIKRQQTLPNTDNVNEYKFKDKKELDILNNNNLLLTKSLST